MTTRAAKAARLQRSLESAHTLIKLWGKVGVGIALAKAYFTGAGWISAVELAKELNISDDTCRRQLDAVATAGRAEVRYEDGRKLYRCNSDLAERTVSLVFHVDRPHPDVNSLAADCGAAFCGGQFRE